MLQFFYGFELVISLSNQGQAFFLPFHNNHDHLGSEGTKNHIK